MLGWGSPAALLPMHSKARAAAGRHLPMAIPPYPVAAARLCHSSLCVLAHGSLSLCFPSCPTSLHLSRCPLPALLRCVPPLAALLSWWGCLLEILLLVGRMSLRACQPALLCLKDADPGASSPSGKAESDLTKQGNKPVSYLDLKHILGVISCLNLHCNYLCLVAFAHHCPFF